MTIMPVTLGTAGILGLLYMYLSARVVMARASSKIMIGDGAQAEAAPEAAKLQVACRAHGNFAEYVPLALILMGGIEMAGASHWFLMLLAILLIASRVAHPIGMSRPAPNPFRAGGAAATWVVIVLESLDALRIAL
jgi:uncharacterized membrane protein YecN with MAPEG domain